MHSVPHRIGIYLGVVQFLFTLTWTVYLIFLPQLAAQVGIKKDVVVFILMADQLIFGLMDLAIGLWADRVARTVGRLGIMVGSLTALSCFAFLLLAPIAAGGATLQSLFLGLTVVWLVTSSALRAPPLMLLGKYVPKPSVPWLASLSLFGLGLSGAVAPYLTVALRQVDPRWPFALSSAALLSATLGIVWAERALANRAAKQTPAAAARPLSSSMIVFLIGIALLALGFQVHFSLNSAPQYLRFAKPADLEYLMPVFWIGFSLLMLPASWWTARFGGLVMMGAGGIIGAACSLVAANAGSLVVLVSAQFFAGGAWGCALMSAVAAALAIGHTGREGAMTGGVFAILALATLARIGAVATQLNSHSDIAAILPSAPAAAWFLAGVLLLAVGISRRRRGSATSATH